MAASRTYKVALVSRAFGPAAHGTLREVAPPEFDLSISDDMTENAYPLIREADFALVSVPITEKLLEESPKLRLLHKWGIGVEKIDLAGAERQGVPVAITGGANADLVAEQTLMLMLAALRRLSYADRTMRTGRWPYAEVRPASRKLTGKTVGIVGFGNVGRNVAQRLQGFGVEIIYHDPVRAPHEVEERLNARRVSFDELIALSDIVSLNCPGGGVNHHLLNAGTFARMKSGAVLVNCARGDVVDEDAMIDALESGQLHAAGLDVYDEEPLPPTSRLLKLDNVVLTPHSAAGVHDALAPVALHAFRNMQRVLKGEPIPKSDLVVSPANPRRFAAD